MEMRRGPVRCGLPGFAPLGRRDPRNEKRHSCCHPRSCLPIQRKDLLKIAGLTASTGSPAPERSEKASVCPLKHHSIRQLLVSASNMSTKGKQCLLHFAKCKTCLSACQLLLVIFGKILVLAGIGRPSRWGYGCFSAGRAVSCLR